jgi:hypothetical protein
VKRAAIAIGLVFTSIFSTIWYDWWGLLEGHPYWTALVKYLLITVLCIGLYALFYAILYVIIRGLLWLFTELICKVVDSAKGPVTAVLGLTAAFLAILKLLIPSKH